MIPMVLKVNSEQPARVPHAARGAAGVHAAAGGQRRGRRARGRELHDRLAEPRHDGPSRASAATATWWCARASTATTRSARPRAFLLSIVSYLTQNPLEKVDVESVEVDLAQTDQPSFANLVGANASRTVVHPGDRVTLNLDFVPYRGDRFRHSLTLDLPGDLHAGPLFAAGGGRRQRRRRPPLPGAGRAGQLPAGAGAAALVPLAARPDRAGDLQPAPASRWRARRCRGCPARCARSGGPRPRGARSPCARPSCRSKREAMDVPIQGLVRIDLEVRRREPVSGDDRKAGMRPASDVASNGQGEDDGMRRARFDVLAAGRCCWPLAACRRAARRSRSSRRAARPPSSPAPSTASASTRSAACSSPPRSTAWPRSPSPSCSPPPSIRDGWVVGTGNAGKVLKIDRKGERHRAVHRSRARGLRRLGRSGRHGLRRHLAARQGLPDPAGEGKERQGGGLLRSRRHLHLGPGPRRRRLPAGRHRHRGEALPGRRQGRRARSSTTARTPTSARSRRSPAATSWSAPPARA